MNKLQYFLHARSSIRYRRFSAGFTLVEMLIVIALIGILAAALVEKMDAALAQARDTRRKADLHKLQLALTVYYARNGNFPLSDTNQNPPDWYSSTGWYYPSGPGNNGNWIPGLAPTFIPRLPQD